MDILASYPDHLTRKLVLWNLLGLYVCFPVILAKSLLWPSYWTERVKVADEYAYALGQGHLLHYHIDMQIRQEEALQQERNGIAREIAQLERQSQIFENQASIRNWSLPGQGTMSSSYEAYHNTTSSQEQFYLVWNQLLIRIGELRKRDLRAASACRNWRLIAFDRCWRSAGDNSLRGWEQSRDGWSSAGATTPLAAAPRLSEQEPRLLPGESDVRK